MCGSGTVKHTGRYGSFLGCSHYPGCHDTQPFKIDRQGHPAATARLRSSIRTTRSPPKPRSGGSWRSASGGSYVPWWFKGPGCKAIYLVEAARRFLDGIGIAEPSSAPDSSADWVTRERAILPWQ